MAKRVKKTAKRKAGRGAGKRKMGKRGRGVKDVWANHKGKILTGSALALAALPYLLSGRSSGAAPSLPSAPTTQHIPRYNVRATMSARERAALLTDWRWY
jgi:hypothetical protein